MALMSIRSRSHVDGFNESQSFICTQLYNITSKYYFKTYFNGPTRLEPATRVRRPTAYVADALDN